MPRAVSKGHCSDCVANGWFCGQERASRGSSLLIPEKPVDITKPLEDQRTTPGEDVMLSCELSRAGSSVRWLKDGKAIRKSQKYDLLSEGTRAVLVVRKASLKDSGEYTCETEASRSTARLCVEGKHTGHCPATVSPEACLGPPQSPSRSVRTCMAIGASHTCPYLSCFRTQKRQTGSRRS